MTVQELLIRQVCVNLSKKYYCDIKYVLDLDAPYIFIWTNGLLQLIIRVKLCGWENYKEIKRKIEPYIKLNFEQH